MGSLAVHRIQHKLNLLTEEIFPLLGDRGTEVVENPPEDPSPKKFKCEMESKADGKTGEKQIDDCKIGNEESKGNSPDGSIEILEKHGLGNLSVRSPQQSVNLMQANTFSTFHLRPRKGLDRY